MTFTGLGSPKTLFLFLVLSSFQRSHGHLIPSHLGTPVEASEWLVSTADHHPGNSGALMAAAVRQRVGGNPAVNRDTALESPGKTQLRASAEPYIPVSSQITTKRYHSQKTVHQILRNAGAWKTSKSVRKAEEYDDVYRKLPASEDLLDGLYHTPQYHLQNTDHTSDPSSLLPESVDELFYAIDP